MSDLAQEMADEMEQLPPEPGAEDRLERLQQMGRRVLVIDEQITVYEERIKVRKLTRKTILEKEMIDLMDAAKVDNVGVDGWTFLAGEYYFANVRADAEDREEAHQWLEDHEAGDLLSNTVIVEFPKEFQAEALALERYAREKYQMATVERRRAVPWKRLTAWVKDYVLRSRAVQPGDEPMEPLPMELLGATTGRVVQLKAPKAEGKKAKRA